MSRSLDYQLALDPFHEPDLFDTAEDSDLPAQASADLEPPGGTWEQGQFEIDFPSSPAKATPQAEVSRKSFSAMVDLALERGSATSIGDLLDQIATLRQHKPFNALLAILQRPHATYLLTPQQWEGSWGRRIRPGEHPIVLLFPHGPVRFLFDVSQTEETEDSRPLPTGLRNPFAMSEMPDAAVSYARLVEVAKSDGVRVSTTRAGYPSAGCIQRVTSGVSQPVAGRRENDPMRLVAVRYEVLINDSFTLTERLATLAHELGHLYCGHVGASKSDRWPSRRPDHPVREFEAETVAILAFKRIAPGVPLPPYLDQFFDPDQEVPEVAWDQVVRAASWVIDMCELPRNHQGTTA